MDRVSRKDLHRDAKLLSLEQLRQKQLYSLMYKLAKKGIARKVTNRKTRNQEKYVFKIDPKIGNSYETSPFYVESQLWDKLPKDTQFIDNIFEFIKEIAKMYGTFKE